MALWGSSDVFRFLFPFPGGPAVVFLPLSFFVSYGLFTGSSAHNPRPSSE